MSTLLKAQANGLELVYETFGKPTQPCILLIMGLGGQLVVWPDAFCQRLAAAGYFVVRYDNRDIGLSTQLNHLGRPNIIKASLRARLGLKVPAPYLLSDMAKDAVGLLDALGVPSAHVVGASMGGMIAQLVAIHHPNRLKSCTLVMSTSGSARLPQAKLALQLRLARGPKARDRESLIAYGMQSWRLIGSQGALAAPEDELRQKVTRAFDRAFRPAGAARQLNAIIASGSRSHLLPRIQAPTLVIHGTDDPLLPVAAAHDLVARIPRAQLKLFPGMGHDFPTPLLVPMADAILAHIHSTEAALAPQRAA